MFIFNKVYIKTGYNRQSGTSRAHNGDAKCLVMLRRKKTHLKNSDKPSIGITFSLI